MSSDILNGMSGRRVNVFHRAMRRVSLVWPMSLLVVHALHHIDRLVFRLTKGRRTLTSVIAGLPVIMLTTIGAKSGERRTIPVLGFTDGDGMVVVADNHGQRRNPAWYHNLRANPRAEIMEEGETRVLRAREAEGGERERLWRKGIEIFPGWVVFQRRAANRRIPVIVLEADE